MLDTLSGRFLILTTVFVMLAEVMIFVPSIARFRVEYLMDRLERAQIASLALLADDMLDTELEAELLENADVYNVVLRRDELRQLIDGIDGVDYLPSDAVLELDSGSFADLTHVDYDLVLNDALFDDPKREMGEIAARFGLGAGLAIITGDEDTSDVEDFDIDTLFSFVLRPSAELRWQFFEHGSIFAGVSYDWVPEDRIDIDIAGDSREVDDDINFDSINVIGGFSFVW